MIIPHIGHKGMAGLLLLSPRGPSKLSLLGGQGKVGRKKPRCFYRDSNYGSVRAIMLEWVLLLTRFHKSFKDASLTLRNFFIHMVKMSWRIKRKR